MSTRSSSAGELGPKLRAIRKARGRTLQDVANATDLSKSFLSQIENGIAKPSIGSLKRITDTLGVPLGALFDADETQITSSPIPSDEQSLHGDGKSNARGSLESPVRVVRKDRRKMIAWPGSDAATELLTPDLQRKLEVLLSVNQPGYRSGDEPYIHEGEEFGLVLEGRYEVTVGEEVFVLEEGDAIYYPSNLPHHTRTLGTTPARVLWVITPPSF